MSAQEVHALVEASTRCLTDVIPAVEDWLVQRVGRLTDDDLLANGLAEQAISDSTILTVSDLAETLGVSKRTIHRITSTYVGPTPDAMIRRRRLQEALEWIREHPSAALADVAARFDFVDQAHLSREARTMLGMSLKDCRQRAHQQA